jgi:glycosyltransferase involved in cell wall biosynthesis
MEYVMKILYFSQWFGTSNTAGGSGRPYDISKYMVKAGHHVHIICGVPSGVEPMPWYKLFKNEVIDGINVTSCNVIYKPEFGFFRRAWSFIRFLVLATLAIYFVKKPDIVFASSTPLTIGIPGYLAAKFRRAPFVFEVRDIMPEAFVESGALKPGLTVWLAERLEAFIYAKAVRIMVVSPDFKKRLVARGLPAEKFRVSPLGADGNIFLNVKPDEEFLDKYNLRGKKIAIYTGAHGRANGLDYVIEAAEFSKDNPNIVYVLLGEGGKKEQYKQLAREKGLTNLVFADGVQKERVPGILAVCDIGLMILRYYGLPRPVLPNKIFDYMFMGIPAIVNFYGPTKEMVEDIGCGVFANPEAPKDLADKVVMLADDSEIRRQMGEKGQKIAWEKYDRKNLANDVLSIFEEVITDWQKK